MTIGLILIIASSIIIAYQVGYRDGKRDEKYFDLIRAGMRPPKTHLFRTGGRHER